MDVKQSAPSQAPKKRKPPTGAEPFTLVILHYHLRPGGIRRVIELATPHLARHFGQRLKQLVLATGEAADKKWDGNFRQLLADYSLAVFRDPALSYASNQNFPVHRARSQIQT